MLVPDESLPSSAGVRDLAVVLRIERRRLGWVSLRPGALTSSISTSPSSTEANPDVDSGEEIREEVVRAWVKLPRVRTCTEGRPRLVGEAGTVEGRIAESPRDERCSAAGRIGKSSVMSIWPEDESARAWQASARSGRVGGRSGTGPTGG